MNNFTSMLKSTIGLKLIMAITGVGLLGFVIAHVSGNCLIFVSGEALNEYGHKLKSMPYVLWPARAGLLAIFFLHVTSALKLRRINLKARADQYIVQTQVQSTLPSRTMLLTGLLILVYVVIHIMHFTLGWLFVDAADHARLDVYAMVVKSFQNPALALVYIGAMVMLGFHLSHGIGSLLKTIGFSDPRYNDRVRGISAFIAAVIALGFIAVPLAVMTGMLTLSPTSTVGL